MQTIHPLLFCVLAGTVVFALSRFAGPVFSGLFDVKALTAKALPLFSFLLGAGILAPGTICKADTVTAFHLNETFDGGAVFSGTINIDTTTGTVLDGVFGATSSFSSVFYQAAGPTFYEFILGDATSSGSQQLVVGIPSTTLVGYAGGNLCSLSNPCGSFVGAYLPRGSFGYPGNESTSFGSLTATPEPSSIALLGTGLVGVVGGLRRRFA